MSRKLGIYASLLLLSTMALFWSGCSLGRSSSTEEVSYNEPVGQSSSYAQSGPGPYAQPGPGPFAQPGPVMHGQPGPVMHGQPGPVMHAPSRAQACPPPCPPKCPPQCPPACAPACPPACPPCPPPTPACIQEPLCKIPEKCHYPSSNELRCLDGITVTASNPNMCMLGEQYPIDFDIHACQDVCDVKVTATLPEGVSFIKSTPEAQVDGKRLNWNIGGMRKDECIHAKVWVKCECEGELCACFCATATPVRFCSLLCAKPMLTCEKCGPNEVCPGDPIHYNITVTNRGSCTANDVLITDTLPDGVEGPQCQKTLTFKLGNLEPCESKSVQFCVTAIKRGKICNTAVVSACNADSTSCQWCTNVCKECIELIKVGPKEQAIGKNADYQITVTNPGDKSLTDIVVTDQAPSATSIVAANGAKISGNQAVWRMKELKPGEKANFTLTLTTCVPGCFTNRVHVTDCQQCEACAEATTRWRGRPALNTAIVSAENPICVGDNNSYGITIVNQGSEADNNVVVTVKIPAELQPTNASGPTKGTINGQTVTFAAYNNFAPRQTLEYRVDVVAKKAGDARVDVSVTSDSAKTPITQQESTIVN